MGRNSRMSIRPCARGAQSAENVVRVSGSAVGVVVGAFNCPIVHLITMFVISNRWRVQRDHSALDVAVRTTDRGAAPMQVDWGIV